MPDIEELGGALEGLRVLDLSQGAAGPTCAMLLGDLGADVVKVEPPGGEWGRALGPPFVQGVAAAFLGMNRNKRSVVINLKHPGGRDVVLRLATCSDVVLESFRPGVADRLGIGDRDLTARNPRIVYASVSAFGRRGPWRDHPGVDGVVQALSGIMSVTGAAGGPPVKVGVPAADMAGAFFTAQAVLAALLLRERTGHGGRADVSLLQSMLAFQIVPLSMYLAEREPPGRHGSAAPYAAPNEAYATLDGHVMVAAYTPERWPLLCAALELRDLADDPRFDTNEKRVRDREGLRAVLEPVFRTRATADWVELLRAADVLCAPLLEYPELVAEPHLAESRAFRSFEHPTLGELTGVAHPVELAAAPVGPRRPPPHLPGEHSQEVLREFGFGGDEIDELLAAEIVQAAPGIELTTT